MRNLLINQHFYVLSLNSLYAKRDIISKKHTVDEVINRIKWVIISPYCC